MLKFVKDSEKLTSREVSYWKKVFDNNLMFASEVEFESKMRDFEVDRARREIECSGNIKEYGNGIECVKSDGSLRRGAEILTPPRRIYSFIQMVGGYKNLIDKLYKYEPVIHPRAGWHNHISLMNINGVKANEKEVPFVILKNLLSLVKHYYPSMVYFASTLPSTYGDSITRYNEFCQHNAMIDYDSKRTVQRTLSNFSSTRYQNVNMNRIETNDRGITRFHIEFRFPDCSLFPVQMASFNIFIKALILKAIELSKYGVINSDITDSDVKDYLIKNTFDSNCEDAEDDWDEDYERYDRDEIEYFTETPDSDDRLSAPILDWVLNRIQKKGMELIALLEDEILKIDEMSFDFVKGFMVNPISQVFRELETNSVEKVNEHYEEILDGLYDKEDDSLDEVSKVISLGLIRNVQSRDMYKTELGELIACKEDVQTLLDKLNKTRGLYFNKRLGYYFK